MVTRERKVCGTERAQNLIKVHVATRKYFCAGKAKYFCTSTKQKERARERERERLNI